jgi:hypothetical protein
VAAELKALLAHHRSGNNKTHIQDVQQHHDNSYDVMYHSNHLDEEEMNDIVMTPPSGKCIINTFWTLNMGLLGLITVTQSPRAWHMS